MSSTLEIAFTNLSSTIWQPDQNSYANVVSGTNPVTSWPDAPMIQGATQNCIIKGDLSKLGAGSTNGGANFYYCWNNGSDWRFGVRINIPLQYFDIGDRPNWEVMSDQNLDSSAITWGANGGSPGDQYTWPNEVPYDIIATPNSGHNGLSIAVIINNIPTKP